MPAALEAQSAHLPNVLQIEKLSRALTGSMQVFHSPLMPSAHTHSRVCILVQQRCRRAQRQPHRGGVPRRRRQARELAVVSACVVGKAMELTMCRRSVRTSWRGVRVATFLCGWTIPRLDSRLCCTATSAARLVSARTCLSVCSSNVRCCQEILSSCAISAALWCIFCRPREQMCMQQISCLLTARCPKSVGFRRHSADGRTGPDQQHALRVRLNRCY